jgi:hypothetical protein
MHELKVYEVICSSIVKYQVYDRIFVKWTSMPVHFVPWWVHCVTAIIHTPYSFHMHVEPRNGTLYSCWYIYELKVYEYTCPSIAKYQVYDRICLKVG